MFLARSSKASAPDSPGTAEAAVQDIELWLSSMNVPLLSDCRCTALFGCIRFSIFDMIDPGPLPGGTPPRTRCASQQERKAPAIFWEPARHECKSYEQVLLDEISIACR